jgi:hypothetical protein
MPTYARTSTNGAAHVRTHDCWFTSYPDEPEFHRILAMAAWGSPEVANERALHYYDGALARSGTTQRKDMANRAALLLTMDRFSEALAAASACLLANPSYHFAGVLKAIAHTALGSVGQAQAEAVRTVRICRRRIALPALSPTWRMFAYFDLLWLSELFPEQTVLTHAEHQWLDLPTSTVSQLLSRRDFFAKFAAADTAGLERQVFQLRERIEPQTYDAVAYRLEMLTNQHFARTYSERSGGVAPGVTVGGAAAQNEQFFLECGDYTLDGCDSCVVAGCDWCVELAVCTTGPLRSVCRTSISLLLARGANRPQCPAEPRSRRTTAAAATVGGLGAIARNSAAEMKGNVLEPKGWLEDETGDIVDSGWGDGSSGGWMRWRGS